MDRRRKKLTYPLNLSRFAALSSPPRSLRAKSRPSPNLLRRTPIHPLLAPRAPLQFGLTPEIVKRPFAEIGDIRTFFDLVEKRAMAFVTYVRRFSQSQSAWD